MDDNYALYDEWKGWTEDRFMSIAPHEQASYDAEFCNIPVRGEKVLEIGFGSGALLAWLRAGGAELYGTELSRQGVKLAAQNGITVLDAGLTNIDALKGRFGIIAAFDVLEHLSYREIGDLLDKAALLLRPGGVFVARFPNGASPFGRMHQHADITHVSTLTAEKIAQLMLGKPFLIQRAGGTAIPMHGGFAARLAKKGRGALRYLFERGVSALYGFKVPFHPNLIVVLRRTGGAESPAAPA